MKFEKSAPIVQRNTPHTATLIYENVFMKKGKIQRFDVNAYIRAHESKNAAPMSLLAAYVQARHSPSASYLSKSRASSLTSSSSASSKTFIGVAFIKRATPTQEPSVIAKANEEVKEIITELQKPLLTVVDEIIQASNAVEIAQQKAKEDEDANEYAEDFEPELVEASKSTEAVINPESTKPSSPLLTKEEFYEQNPHIRPAITDTVAIDESEDKSKV